MKKLLQIYLMLILAIFLITNLAYSKDQIVNQSNTPKLLTKSSTNAIEIPRSNAINTKSIIKNKQGNKNKITSSAPKIIFFNDLCISYAFDTPYDYADAGYYQYMSNWSDYGDLVISLPFTDEVLDTLTITDYELAIFPIGENSLSAKTDKGVSILSKIKEMIAAQKHVIIYGNDILWWAFSNDAKASPGHDAEVIDFLSNTMGVNYIQNSLYMTTSETSGSTTTYSFTGFEVRGVYQDSVGQSIWKFCNFSNQNPPRTCCFSLATNKDIDLFHTKDATKYFPVEYFVRNTDLLATDSLAAIRTFSNDSRILLYTIGLESMGPSGVGLADDYVFHSAVQWCMTNVPVDGPVISTITTSLDFGNVALNKPQTMNVEVKNVGNQKLVIYYDTLSFNDGNSVKIISGDIQKGHPVSLNFQESHTFTIQFTPTEERSDYSSWFDVYSNSIPKPDNAYNDLMFTINGAGGAGSGAKISTNFPDSLIDFGQVKLPNSKDSVLIIYNTGDQELKITSFGFSKDEDSLFRFMQVIQTPIFVEPDSSCKIKLRFITNTTPGIYHGNIHIVSNAMNSTECNVSLKGEVVAAYSNITFDQSNLDFSSINPKSTSSKTVKITNTGNTKMTISSISLGTPSGAYSFVSGNDVTDLKAGDSFNLVVKFAPTSDALTTYTDKITIASDATNSPTAYINLTGVGDPNVSSVGEYVSTQNGVLTLKAAPNPFSEKTSITYINHDLYPQNVKIELYNINLKLIRQLVNENTDPGEHTVTIDSKNLSIGYYFIVATIGNERVSLPVTIIK